VKYRKDPFIALSAVKGSFLYWERGAVVGGSSAAPQSKVSSVDAHGLASFFE